MVGIAIAAERSNVNRDVLDLVDLFSHGWNSPGIIPGRFMKQPLTQPDRLMSRRYGLGLV